MDIKDRISLVASASEGLDDFTLELRKSTANIPHLRNATPLSQVIASEIKAAETARQSRSDDDPIVMALYGRAHEHIQLLAEYQATLEMYEAALNQLRDLTSPVVGRDVPWRCFYTPEYHSIKARNPSTLPTNHLNEQPLQKACRTAIRTSDEADYTKALAAAQRDPARAEQQLDDLMLQRPRSIWAAWNRLRTQTDARAEVIPSMQRLIAAAEPFKPKDSTTLEKAIPEMKAVIHETLGGLDEAKASLSHWYMPTIHEDIRRLAPFVENMHQAEAAIDAAATALRAGDQAKAQEQFLTAQRIYIMTAETPRFKTLISEVQHYQELSMYPKLAVMVLTVRVGATFGALAAVGSRGALAKLLVGPGLAIASRSIAGINVGRAILSSGSLAANATAFSVAVTGLNHVVLGEALPKGAKGWGYEIGSNIVLFGILGVIHKHVAAYAKGFTQNMEQAIQRMGITTLRGEGFVINSINKVAPPHRLLKWIPGATGEVLQLIPTYAFFAVIWTPLDAIAMDAVTTGEMPTQAKVDAAFEQSYALQSLAFQLGFIAALSVGKKEGLTKLLAEKLNARLMAPVEQKINALQVKRTQLQEQIEALRTDATGIGRIQKLEQEVALMRDIAATLRKEHAIWDIITDNSSEVADYKSQLRSTHDAYDLAAQQQQAMASLLRVLHEAQVQPIGTELMTYAPTAESILKGLCQRNSDYFTMRDIGGGNFVMGLRDGSGKTSEVTLIPETAAPLSDALDIVPTR